jgi:hypothetical protein
MMNDIGTYIVDFVNYLIASAACFAPPERQP